jgi:hypothetical protein
MASIATRTIENVWFVGVAPNGAFYRQNIPFLLIGAQCYVIFLFDSMGDFLKGVAPN